MLPARYPNEIETNAPIRIGRAGAASLNALPNSSLMIWMGRDNREGEGWQ